VRVGRNRRRTFLYTPLLLIGALMFLAALAAFPIINAAYLAGVAFLITGAAGFVLETGQPTWQSKAPHFIGSNVTSQVAASSPQRTGSMQLGQMSRVHKKRLPTATGSSSQTGTTAALTGRKTLTG
jgi:hypothetical protein